MMALDTNDIQLFQLDKGHIVITKEIYFYADHSAG